MTGCFFLTLMIGFTVYLERMTRELDSDPTLDAVHCRYARVASDGTEVVDKYCPPSGDMFPTLARRAAFPIHACIVRKSARRRGGKVRPLDPHVSGLGSLATNRAHRRPLRRGSRGARVLSHEPERGFVGCLPVIQRWDARSKTRPLS